jgi:Homeodomain
MSYYVSYCTYRRLQLTPCIHSQHPQRDTHSLNSAYSSINTRMRPPTRSTRSVRPPSNKPNTNARGSRGCSTSDPLNPPPSQPKQPQSTVAATAAAAAADAPNVVTGKSPGGSDPAPALVLGYFPLSPPPPPATFIFENQRPELEDQFQTQTGPAGPNASAFGKPPRSRHRMTSNKLETLDALFRRNTHPSRKEKEAICKDLNM